MFSFLSCFACGNSSSVQPKEQPEESKRLLESNRIVNAESFQEMEDSKSKTSTTHSFVTARSSVIVPYSQRVSEGVKFKIDEVRSKPLHERKLIEAEFVKQNLSRTSRMFLVELKWSELYTQFLRSSSLTEIRPINNGALLDSKGFLKDSITFKEDYFVVNELVWAFVQQLYGGGPAIVRDNFFPVVLPMTKKLDVTPMGISNPANLCYMISTLQALLSIGQFAYYFYKSLYAQSSQKGKKTVHSALTAIIVMTTQSNIANLNIEAFAQIFQDKFDPSQQHDPQQFLLNLFNCIQEQFSGIPSRKQLVPSNSAQQAYSAYMNTNKSLVDRIFVGQIGSTVACHQCGTRSSAYEPSFDLFIEISDDSLQECLAHHFAAEKLGDLYDCDYCRKKTRASRQLYLNKTPAVLIITLKRFRNSGRKNDTRVLFPEYLSMKPYCIGHAGQSNYRLLSLICHKGIRPNKGHYKSYSQRNGRWFECNDGYVGLIQKADVLWKDPYMLIYERDR